MKKITTISLILTAIVLPFSLMAAEATATAQLEQLLNNVKTYEANFHQKIKDAQGTNVAQAEGTVRISRPNHFYWKSNKPDPIIVIADGKYLWNYDVDLAQVTQQALGPVMKNSPAGILAGESTKLTQAFQVKQAKSQQCSGKVDQCFMLQPKDTDAGYSHVILGFQDHKLVEIRMQDGLGQDVLTVFKQVQINHPIDAKIYQFKPGKGVDVIHADQ